MSAIEQIRFDELSVWGKLGEAPTGRILQIGKIDAAPQVVLRAEIARPSGGFGGIVPINGDTRSIFAHDTEVSDRAAIDLSEIVDIVLSGPSPERPRWGAGPIGSVCQVTIDNEPTWGMSISTIGNPNVHSGYMLLTGTLRGFIMQNATTAIVLGTAEVVPKALYRAAKP